MSKQTKESKTTKILKHLSKAIGVSGYRGANNVHQAIITEMKPYVDRIEQDRMDSLIGFKAGEQDIENKDQRRKIMLAAHLDEIGAVVTEVDRGFLRFSEVGGLDDRVLMGQEVIIHSRRDLPGIIGAIPPHFSRLRGVSNEVNQTKMLIDVGLPPDQVKELVEVGDLISFLREPDELMNNLLSGKAMDNRSSVTAMIICLRTLQKLRHQWDVYAVATADEEWGSFVGATTQAYAIRPDVALVIDVTFADVGEIDVKLNKGPVIGLGPSNHPIVRKKLIDICKEMELKYQSEVMPSGAGTDAYAIEISREGIPTVLISVPSRYMHSPVEVVHIKDIERIGRLMAYFIASLDESFVETLIPTNQESENNE